MSRIHTRESNRNLARNSCTATVLGLHALEKGYVSGALATGVWTISNGPWRYEPIHTLSPERANLRPSPEGGCCLVPAPTCHESAPVGRKPSAEGQAVKPQVGSYLIKTRTRANYLQGEEKKQFF